MSEENVEVVKWAVAAVNQRDIDGPDFRITIERLEAVGTGRVLAFMQVTATGRASGIPMGAEAGNFLAETGNVYDFANGKIRRIRIFVDRDQALEAAGLRE